MPDKIDPLTELKTLEARKIAQAAQFKQETAAAQARVDALYLLQTPIWKAVQAHREKREAIRRVEQMIALFTADAEAKRENLHAETIIRDPVNQRGIILSLHGEIHHLEAVADGSRGSITRLQSEADAIKAEAAAYAAKNDLVALLDNFDQPLD